ncbi:MAG: DUF805 domain-containing protein [Bacteroidales bacterium]|nr:DUF805 domain-containing protein [Bacteroidales bacterium]
MEQNNFTAPPQYKETVREQRQVSIDEAIKRGFQNYINFNGRASRSEYWWWALFSFAVGIVAGWLGEVVAGIATLALLLPGLAVAVRRLHDIGKGGGYIFMALIPVVGAIILLLWYCKPSEEGNNRFGAEPNMA